MNNSGASVTSLHRTKLKPFNSDIEGIFERPVLKNAILAKQQIELSKRLSNVSSGQLSPIVLESPRLLLQNKKLSFMEQQVQTDDAMDEDLNFLADGFMDPKAFQGSHVHKPIMASDLRREMCPTEHHLCLKH